MAVPLAASNSGGSSFLPLLIIIVLFGAMYLLFIRPQQRRNREVQAMQAKLGPGDEVMTGSGIYGTVDEVDEEEGTISLEVSPGVVVKFARGAVARTINQAPREEDYEEEAAEDVEYETDEADETDETDFEDAETADTDETTRPGGATRAEVADNDNNKVTDRRK